MSPGIDLVEERKEQVLPRGASWAVHKFGGTCVGSFERIQNVAKIIVEDSSIRKVAVVSAMSKVTDMMYELLRKAQARDESYNSALDAVFTKHKETAVALLEDGEDLKKFLGFLEADIQNLRAMLKAICIGMSHVIYTKFRHFYLLYFILSPCVMLRCLVLDDDVKGNYAVFEHDLVD
jgi:aspartokinase/homoserine dehydrogenase 1